MKKAQNSVDPDKDSFDYDLLPGLIGYNLRRAQTAVFQDFSESLKACDITPGQFGVLILIQANSGLNQTRLGNALGIDRSTVVAVIDRLEGRGLVLREPVPRDRRSYALRLSDQGQTLLAQARTKVAEHEIRISHGLDLAEQKQLIALLSRLQDAST
ncbi:MAG: MarR family transcriptional regulator [Rhodospirillaceae bacterium]|jgi:DNA-binding MarR family transcriptional regulator|nr:MarR family transcriptional regulator [Rhodospirillaceae bacterium]MBT4044614.1 MarR family transcriptional regulator [Rhodospirillaceae bacterium]MBT4686623.1 MarR family transcriptional regulator [Rhodospirillaceae bacterium]MBT5082209.1 MarR family transcriptional regulator [Rhodospirillaceae bacterium]MBT5526728.1 MarR family transcriptional regulator [Rhodospirillaceae bacterium]